MDVHSGFRAMDSCKYALVGGPTGPPNKSGPCAIAHSARAAIRHWLQLTTKDFVLLLGGHDGHGERALDGMDD